MMRSDKLALLSLFILLVAVCSISNYPTQVGATSLSNWSAGRIIDDVIFTNSDSMSKDQIQSFLNSKVPVCDTNGTQVSEFGGGTRAQWGQANYGQNTFICLKDYSENGKSSAQIIYDTAQEFRINPQVLIVLLQKEQGLVTDTWPLNLQYKTATGYGCPDTAACDSQYFGLTNQIRWSASMFRAILNKSPTWYTPYLLGNNYIQYNPSSSCGGSVINVENRSTQALYNYTPYQPNQSALNSGYGSGDSCGAYGNRNFYLYFTEWFGTTISGEYPSPLYRSQTSGMIYLIIDSTKYYIPSYEIMVDYGFHKLLMTSVSDTYLSTFTDGPVLTNVGRKQYDSSGAIYLFDDGKTYQIKSPDQCAKWGIDCFNSNVSKVLPNDLFDKYMVGAGLLPDTIRSNGVVYTMEDGKKRPIIGVYAINNFNGNSAPYFKDQNVVQPLGKLIADDRFIVKFGEIPTIYLYDRGYLHAIEDMDDFYSWRLNDLAGANLPTAYDSDPLPRANSIKPVAKSLNDGQMYIISNGFKYSLNNRTTDFNSQPYTNFPYQDSQLDRLPTAQLTDVLRARSSGEIFTVSNNKKRVFASIDDIKNLGFNVQLNTNISQRIANILGYDGLNMAPGKLYKVKGTNEIRIRYKDGYQYVGSMNYSNLDYSKTLNVDIETGNLYVYLGEYRP